MHGELLGPLVGLGLLLAVYLVVFISWALGGDEPQDTYDDGYGPDEWQDEW